MHNAIIDLGISLNYFDSSDALGVCNGVTMAWLSSCLTGDEEQYWQRILHIVKKGPTFFQTKVQMAEKLQQHVPGTPHAPLTTEEGHLIQSLSFYEQIMLYQVVNNRLHNWLFQKFITQSDV
ncbi:MAG: hypothetical protein ACHP65_10430, partial [Legionellales bacterium]